jgi:hypothetical protein
LASRPRLHTSRLQIARNRVLRHPEPPTDIVESSRRVALVEFDCCPDRVRLRCSEATWLCLLTRVREESFLRYVEGSRKTFEHRIRGPHSAGFYARQLELRETYLSSEFRLSEA